MRELLNLILAELTMTLTSLRWPRHKLRSAEFFVSRQRSSNLHLFAFSTTISCVNQEATGLRLTILFRKGA